MKTILPVVLLIAGAGLMQAGITQSITIDLSALHAGSTLSGTFTLPDTPKSGDTAPAVLSFSDPSNYSPTSLTATITIGDGTALPFTVSFSTLTFTNPTGNRFTTNVNLAVAGAAQCASFPCTATGRFEDGSPAVFSSTYSIAPAAAVTPPASTPGGNIWAVTTQNAVLLSDGSQWQTVTGTMKQVSVAADGTVVAVDPNGNDFSWTGSGWKQMPGSLVQISAGAARNIWGVDAQNNVFRWDGNNWTQMPGAMKQVSVSADGSTWAVDNAGNISFWSGTAWQAVPGVLAAQVSAGSATNVWGVNFANNVLRWDGQQWTQVPGAMQQVAVAQDGAVVALDLNGNVFRWTGTLWAPLAGANVPIAQISTGINGRIEDDNAALAYKGAWTKIADAAASGGAYTVSGAAGDTLTYAFTGDTVSIFRHLDANGGQADVTIDGKPWGTLSFHHADAKQQIPAALDHLGAGPHTLVLTVSATIPPGSTGTNVTIDAVSAPAPFVPNAEQSAALDRFNFYRALAQLPPASLSMAMDLAAQAHADYIAGTGVLSHVETPGTPGFVGAGFGDRTQYFGYDQSNGEIAFSGVDATGSVDGWMSTVYHRTPILGYLNTDIGYGISRLNGNLMTVANIGSKRATPPAARVFATYPIDGQVDVPNSWSGGESPDPLPGKQKPVGYPISLQIAQPANAPAVANTTPNLGELFDSNNQPVPVYYLDKQTDANQSLDANTFFVIPQQPLKIASTYRAHMKGTDSAGNPFDLTWSFTTLQATAISDVLIFQVGSADAWVQWSTAGPVATTFIDFGTTTTYGSQAQVNNPGQGPNSYVAHLTGLTPGTTYHLRVTAQDASGKAATSGDFTLTTLPAPPATAISGVLVFGVVSDNAWIQWSTGGAVDKTFIDFGTTTDYGSQAQVNNPGQGPNSYVAHLTGLTPKTTYHFRVTAQAAGKTETSADATFDTP